MKRLYYKRISQVFFNILPAFIDVIVAVFYLSSAFNFWFGVICLATLVVYVATTLSVVEWRTKFRRQMNLLDNKRNQKVRICGFLAMYLYF